MVPSMLTSQVKVSPFFTVGGCAVIALDVLDVLGAVSVGLVGQDLRDTGLGGIDVERGGDEEAGLPEAEYQDHGDDDRGEQADHGADERQRLLRALFGARGAVGRVLTGCWRTDRAGRTAAGLSVLTGLPGWPWGLTRLPVLTGMRITRLAVLPGLLTVLVGRRVLRGRRVRGAVSRLLILRILPAVCRRAAARAGSRRGLPGVCGGCHGWLFAGSDG